MIELSGVSQNVKRLRANDDESAAYQNHECAVQFGTAMGTRFPHL